MEVIKLADNYDISSDFVSDWVYLGERKYWSMALSVPSGQPGEWRVENWANGTDIGADNKPISGTILATFNPDATGKDILSDNNVAYTWVRVRYVSSGSAGLLNCSIEIKDK